MKQLLIERISNIEIPKQQILESMGKNDGRLIIPNVLLQRADKPNRNKRVYPKRVLDKALNEYFTKIHEKRAFSELDHPLCFWNRTEIFTNSGWKPFKNLLDSDKVMTLDVNTNTCKWGSINKIINEKYTGKMYRIIGNNIDTCVTPNHKFYLKGRNDRFAVKTAKEIYDNFDKMSKYYIPITSNWEGVKYESWTIPPNTDYMGELNNRKIQNEPLILNVKEFFAFLGFYLAEGCVTDKSNGYRILVSQNEGERAKEFRKILSNLGGGLTWVERVKHDTNISFEISDARLYQYLLPLGNKYNKFIPEDVKSASTELLNILLDWYNKGDGSNVTYRGYNRKTVFTVSDKLINDLNEIVIKTGKAGVIKIQPNHLKDRYIGERLIKGENSKPLNRLWIKRSKGIYLDDRFLKIEEIDFDDTIHCVSVDDGTIYCRDNGKPFWSGNSDLANTISLKNVCQVIKDARWNGNEIYGDVEILNTPSGNIVKEILKAGYRVGQSSRGMGSVDNITEGDDEDLVEVLDDFEFLTLADCVSDPSTHNADMILGESVSNGNKTITESKYDSLMRDILCEMGSICCNNFK